jgi:predicted nucleotidyltransferase
MGTGRVGDGGRRALVGVLRAEGLIEAAGRETWTITQAGQTFSSATAARLVTRATAERALSQFLERVNEVNQNPYFLAKVTRVVLFGSMLKPEAERLSDVDVAIELTRKNPDFERARGQNQRRAEELADLGRGFRNVLEWEGCWYWEAFRFLNLKTAVDLVPERRNGYHCST